MVSISEVLVMDAVREVHFSTAWVIFIVASACATVVASMNLHASSSLSEREEAIASASACIDVVILVSK